MKWSSGRDGSIEIETDDGTKLAFASIDDLDKFTDELTEALNEAAEAAENNGD